MESSDSANNAARWTSGARLLAVTALPLAAVVAASPTVGTFTTAASLAGAFVVGTLALSQRTAVRRRRRPDSLQSPLAVLPDDQRSVHEQLHELRGTVAGLVGASRLVTDPRVDEEARRRLLHSMRAELERMERLLSPGSSSSTAAVGTVDVDESLDSVLALHRARGRKVEWTPTGARIIGRQDALKEAVNILLDNAAVHGSSDGARVDVADSGDMVQIAVTDEGPGVPADMRPRIFEWGGQRPDSPGQGIGLHVAQRLVSEQGGSLSLSCPGDGGSSFVIRLPRVRQSEEYDSVRTDRQSG
ncbi:MAG: HAMP domain-containing histidine kinase [Nocardioides sp.]|nr:HAMP domain-containing histidine kinase [Nocardioides sp.]